MTETYLGNPPQNVLDWIKTHSQPAATPSPYFAYDSNRVITGLHQGSPNVQAEGGWTYGGSNVVENYATAIGNNAFDDSAYIEGGILPSKGIYGNITFQNVTSIGEYSFFYCSGLTSVTIGNGVTSIGKYAFRFCSGLTSMTIPDSVTSIGEYAFSVCTSLTSVTIQDSVTNIGYYAFADCSNLMSITIGSGIRGIGESAFATNGSPITLTIGKTIAEVQAMGQTDYDFNTNAPYLAWYLPAGSTIVCTDGTITIE